MRESTSFLAGFIALLAQVGPDSGAISTDVVGWIEKGATAGIAYLLLRFGMSQFDRLTQRNQESTREIVEALRETIEDLRAERKEALMQVARELARLGDVCSKAVGSRN